VRDTEPEVGHQNAELDRSRSQHCPPNAGWLLEIIKPLQTTNVQFDRVSGLLTGTDAANVAPRPPPGRLAFEGIALYPNGVSAEEKVWTRGADKSEEILVDGRRLELPTSALRTRRSPN
jgi:hypothetical protein